MIALIVAYAKKQVIGNKGKIPWQIKGEQARFKELTTGHVVIMGRRSYEEIGKPLPNRTTIVVSNTKNYDNGETCFTVPTLDAALKLAGDQDVYISGGARLYQEALPLVDKMYITEIDADIDGDTFFPSFQQDLFTREVISTTNGPIPYSYVTYTKK
ncbi:MAG: dihydrofolate reductase [Lachnospiraceae bacterium]|nr:dihydrofolate reductase [Lachnospiraceae bacterium]